MRAWPEYGLTLLAHELLRHYVLRLVEPPAETPKRSWRPGRYPALMSGAAEAELEMSSHVLRACHHQKLRIGVGKDIGRVRPRKAHGGSWRGYTVPGHPCGRAATRNVVRGSPRRLDRIGRAHPAFTRSRSARYPQKDVKTKQWSGPPIERHTEAPDLNRAVGRISKVFNGRYDEILYWPFLTIKQNRLQTS